MTPEEIRVLVSEQVIAAHKLEAQEFRKHIQSHLDTLKSTFRVAGIVLSVIAVAMVSGQSFSLYKTYESQEGALKRIADENLATVSDAARKVVDSVESNAMSEVNVKIDGRIKTSTEKELKLAELVIRKKVEEAVAESVARRAQSDVKAVMDKAFEEAKVKLLESNGDLLKLSKIASDLLPLGTIIPWSVPIERRASSIEELNTSLAVTGWRICDGRDGTPDLNERFLMGTTDFAGIGQIGGNNTIPTEGEHSHGLGSSGNAGWTRLLAGDVQVAAEHSHSVSSAGGHNHGGDNRPNFYTVVYIMRVATVLGSSSG